MWLSVGAKIWNHSFNSDLIPSIKFTDLLHRFIHLCPSQLESKRWRLCCLKTVLEIFSGTVLNKDIILIFLLYLISRHFIPEVPQGKSNQRVYLSLSHTQSKGLCCPHSPDSVLLQQPADHRDTTCEKTSYFPSSSKEVEDSWERNWAEGYGCGSTCWWAIV